MGNESLFSNHTSQNDSAADIMDLFGCSCAAGVSGDCDSTRNMEDNSGFVS